MEILSGVVEIEFWGFWCISFVIIGYHLFPSSSFRCVMALAPALLGLKWFIKTIIFLIKYKHPIVPPNSLVTRLLISIPVHIILIAILKYLINSNSKP